MYPWLYTCYVTEKSIRSNGRQEKRDYMRIQMREKIMYDEPDAEENLWTYRECWY